MASPSYFCAACGDTERVKKSSGRRKVTTSSSRNVYSLLESIIGNKISERNLQVDVAQLMEETAYMCKNCFYAYEKHIQSLEVAKM